MRELAERIVRSLERKGITPTADHEIYVYGFDTAMYTFFSTTGLVLIGCLLGRGIETVIIVALFYVNQTLGGGFHASTHRNCFIVMVLRLLVCLATFLLPFNRWVYCALGGLGLLQMFKNPLILHKHREYLRAKRDIFCKRSRAMLGVQGICLIAIVLSGLDVYVQAFCVSLVVCAISRGAAKLLSYKSISVE